MEIDQIKLQLLLVTETFSEISMQQKIQYGPIIYLMGNSFELKCSDVLCIFNSQLQDETTGFEQDKHIKYQDIQLSLLDNVSQIFTHIPVCT